MDTQERFVIAVSGQGAVGKTTLVKNLAALLSSSATLFYDDYWKYDTTLRFPEYPNPQDCTEYPSPAYLRWINEGCSPNHWVTMPQFVDDLRALRTGRSVKPVADGRPIEPTPIIVIEEPWGRERDEISTLIDFVIHIDIPLDVSICRVIAQQSDYSSCVGAARCYLGQDRPFYMAQQAVGRSADIVLNGFQDPDTLANQGFRAVRRYTSQ
jgi:uridine kinase